MSRKENYERRTEELLIPLAEKYKVSIYDVEFVKEGDENYLRAYIDKSDGITIDDCENVSRELSTILDQEDFIEESYIFEVSSPGLCRQLKKDKHFESVLGKKIECKTYKVTNGIKEFEGILKSYNKDTICLVTEEAQQEVTLERNNLAMARLAFTDESMKAE